MTALHPAMLAGLAALAIPVVLHLIARHRFPVRDLPTTRFLQPHQRTNVLAPRLVDVPQLILRLLLLAALVLAMSRLLVGSAPNVAPRNLVLVIDASSSMKMKLTGSANQAATGTGAEAGTAFDVAVAAARAAIAALPAGSRVGLVSDSLGGAIDHAPTVDVASIDSRLAALRPIDGRGRSLAEMAARGCEMVRGRREARSQVLVMSDLRASALEHGGDEARARMDAIRAEMGERLEIALVDVAGEAAANVGVVAVQLRGGEARVGEDAHVVARLHNSENRVVEPSIRLTVGGRTEATPRKVALEAESEAVVDLPMRVSRAASTLARVETEADGYEADNAASTPVPVVDARRVLLVTSGQVESEVVDTAASLARRVDSPAAAMGIVGATATPGAATQPGEPASPALSGAAILRFALNPGRELGSGQSSGIEVTQVDAEAVGTQPLSKYDVMILYGATRLSAQALSDVRTLVEQGRSLVVFCPEAMSALEFNRHLADQAGAAPSVGPTTAAMTRPDQGPLIPLRLGIVKVYEQAAALRVGDEGHPWLAAFRDPLRGDLSSLQFQRVREIPVTPEAALVLLRTKAGDPLVIESAFGRGRVIVMAFGVELSAGNLARSRVFPVLMWRLVDYLTGRLDRQPSVALTAMRPALIELSEPALRLAGDLELAPFVAPTASQPATQPGAAPAPAPMAIKVDDRGNVLLPPLAAGEYLLRRRAVGGAAAVASGRWLSVIADPAESRMRRASDAELRSTLGDGVRTVEVGQVPSLAPVGSEWAGRLVMVGVVLYLVEAMSSWLLSARRERQRKTEAGA